MVYTIRAGRIRAGLLEGVIYHSDGSLKTAGEEGVHQVFLPALDNHGQSSGFGRIRFDWELAESAVCSVYVLIRQEETIRSGDREILLDEFFCNPKIPAREKKQFFLEEGCINAVNTKDMILYSRKGRYLWLFLEFTGSAKVSRIQVQSPGDNFMQTFPEIYQEEGGFFHRYLSVFSSIYGDMQEKIEGLHQLLEVETTQDELLPLLGQWLGIDSGREFIAPEKLRVLIRRACWLNQRKGTKEVMESLVEILTGQTPVIIERNLTGKYIRQEETALYDRLYGSSPMDVTVLIPREVANQIKMQTEFLLNQFKPVRSRLHMVFLQETGMLDTYCYMDKNARITGAAGGKLDCGIRMEQSFIMQEQKE